MRTRLAAGLAAALALAAAPAAAEAIRAVVIGVDDYIAVSPLEGAVNDARDIAAALEGRGAEVTLLLDRAATRRAVIDAIRAALVASRAGDAVVVTYAGHGAGFPEALAGDEADGQDETFILAGFENQGPNAAERLRDNDLAALLMEAPPGVGVLVVADSCHSGTMTRAPVGPARLGRSRWTPTDPIEDDPLPPPDPATWRAETTAIGAVALAAAARDDQVTPEIEIDGAKRGALSYAVARALEGRLAGTGRVTLADIRGYVRTEVRARSFARQDPDFTYPDALDPAAETALLRLFDPKAGGVPAPERGGPDLALAPEPAIHRLAPGETASEAPPEARLIHDPEAPALLDRVSGDLIGRPADDGALARMVLAWRAARGVSLWAPWRPAELRLTEGDGRHMLGERIELVMRAPEGAPALRYATLVNLASGGEAQYVFPSEEQAASGKDLVPPPPGALRISGIPVTEPVGADTVVAIYTAERPEALRAALRRLGGEAAPERLLALLAEHAADPGRARVAALTIYTGDGR